MLKLPQPVPASRIATTLDVDREELRRLNPALLNTVWKGARNVPKGYEFRVPSHIDLSTVMAKLNAGGATDTVEVAIAESQHRVESGETLSVIAGRYGVSQQQLAELNDLNRPYRLRVGQVLELPSKGTRPGGHRRAGAERNTAAGRSGRQADASDRRGRQRSAMWSVGATRSARSRRSMV